jgi:acyl carrier protein
MNAVETIKNILASEIFVEIPPSQMNVNDSLRDVFGLDSLGFVELRVQCEDMFGITISDDDFSPENFSTISNVVALVQRLVEASGQGVPAASGRDS